MSLNIIFNNDNNVNTTLNFIIKLITMSSLTQFNIIYLQHIFTKSIPTHSNNITIYSLVINNIQTTSYPTNKLIRQKGMVVKESLPTMEEVRLGGDGGVELLLECGRTEVEGYEREVCCGGSKFCLQNVESAVVSGGKR
ncbi:unnamed protein product [Vicia faba]|uniref:Uncharacterized protein n=1 Tax=Vicia faba TaxID=3906 RepID=A0AAV1B198_VICFA|nr:unnamed protein product [Vicia faba]